MEVSILLLAESFEFWRNHRACIAVGHIVWAETIIVLQFLKIGKEVLGGVGQVVYLATLVEAILEHYLCSFPLLLLIIFCLLASFLSCLELCSKIVHDLLLVLVILGTLTPILSYLQGQALKGQGGFYNYYWEVKRQQVSTLISWPFLSSNHFSDWTWFSLKYSLHYKATYPLGRARSNLIHPITDPSHWPRMTTCFK